MRIKMKRFLGILLSLALILGLMPGMSLTAYADGTTYNPASTYNGFGDLNTNNTEVTISEVSGKTWYVIANDSSTVTLLSKESFGNSEFNDSGSSYASSTVKTYVEGLTGDNQSLAGIKDVLADVSVTNPDVTGKVPYLLSISEATSLSNTKMGDGCWWLRSPGTEEGAAYVDQSIVCDFGDVVSAQYGVRPALKLDLSKVSFDSESKEFSLNSASNTTEYTTLQVGDVLHVGDSINSTTEYSPVDDMPLAWGKGPWTLVRADIIASANDVDVTESETGAYYLFKDSVGGYSVVDEPEESQGFFGAYYTATATSDGIYVTSVQPGNDKDAQVRFAVHEDIAVTGVTLDKTTAQMVTVGDTVSFNATVAPDNASDKTVKWSVGGTNADAVTLYSDEACGTPITLDTATETMTVYAKGISAGSATVTATSNADSEKSASCDVTVNEAVSDDPYASLLNTTTVVKFDNKDWYLIEDNSTAADAGTVTLLAKDCVGEGAAYNSNGSFVEYSSGPTVKTAVNSWYNDNITAGAKTAVNGGAMFLLTKEEANKITNADVGKCTNESNGGWWLCSQGYDDSLAAFVDGENGNVDGYGRKVIEEFGVRPALKLNLSSVIFSSESNAFSLKPADNTVTWSDLSDISIGEWESVTKDGVTVTLGSNSHFMNGNLNLGSCIFTASQGGISGITIQTENDLRKPFGGWPSGWIADGSTLTWSGDPAVEVSLEGMFLNISSIQQITFTMSDTGTGTRTVWTNETIEIDGEVTVNRRIIVNGNVTLNLKEGSKLIANAGINVSAGNSLTIQGSGELIASIDEQQSSQADHDMAAIGGNDEQDAGTVTITGGTIEAHGGANAAGIGGGDNGNGGTINISGGTVTAIGGSFGAGIGGGNGKNGGTVNISGGTVIATGGQYGSNGGSSSGIGKSGFGSDDGTLNLGDGVLMQVSSDNTTWSEYGGSDRARYMKSHIPTIDILVTGLTLDKTTAQIIDEGNKVSFTATVSPDNASDKTVKWSVSGTNATAVKLYSDENCTTEVGTDATETLTVYAKGISAGSATVTCTSNADSTKSASCDVTVNAGNTTFDPASTYTGFGDLNTNDTEVTISEVSGKNWYVIANDSSTVTLLSKQSFGSQKFNSDEEKGNAYGTSDIKTYVEGLTGEGQSLAGIKDALADVSVTAPVVTGKVPYLLSQSEAGNLSSTKKTGAGIDWWLRSPGDEGVNAAFVYGESGNVNAIGRIVIGVIGVRPALKLDLSKVTFDSESKTFSVSAAGYNVTITAGSNMTKTTGSGAASQTGLSGAMTDVVYTADDGYYFPTNYSVVSVNGISVSRNSYTQITVSGTPTADAAITLLAPTAKTDQTAPTGLTATKASSSTATDGKISGVTSAMEYQKNGTSTWTTVENNKTEITGLTSGTYKVRYAGTADKNASPEATITIGVKENQTAPTGLTATKASSSTATDGKISGVTSAMEYQKDGDSTWTAVEENKTEITGLTAGTYKVRYAETADKNASPETSVEVGVKVAPTVTAPTAKTLTYNGQAQDLVTAGSTDGGEMQYALGTATEATEQYTTSIPAKTDAGTYYVWYKAVGDEDHSDSKPACITVTISKPAEKPAPADEEKGEADFKPNAAAPDVKGVEQEAIKSQMEDLAKADDTKLKAGQVKDVTVSMETKAVAEKDVPKKEASAIKETAEGMIPAKDRESTKCDFLDIAVSKIVIVYDVKNGKKVKNESDSISANLTNLAQVIDIPVKYDLTGKFNPLIVRYHNGKAEAFRRLYAAPAKDALKDGTYYVEGTGKNAIVHIYTNSFSTYALLTSGTEEYPKLGDSVTVYRLYYGPTMEHFYTTSAYERRVLIDKYGWVDEGIAWKSPKAPTTDEEKKTIKPVYRLFNPFTTDHHYTKDANERKTLIDKYGWKDEGVAFYSNDKGDATVYRLWHPGLITGAHHFTTGKHEYDVLITRGWIGETEAFKVNAAS